MVVEAVVSSVYLLEVIAVVKRCCSSLFVLLPIIYIIMIVISVISLSKCLHLDLQEEAELVNLLPRLLVNSIGRTTAKIYLYANYSYWNYLELNPLDAKLFILSISNLG